MNEKKKNEAKKKKRNKSKLNEVILSSRQHTALHTLPTYQYEHKIWPNTILVWSFIFYYFFAGLATWRTICKLIK